MRLIILILLTICHEFESTIAIIISITSESKMRRVGIQYLLRGFRRANSQIVMALFDEFQYIIKFCALFRSADRMIIIACLFFRSLKLYYEIAFNTRLLHCRVGFPYAINHNRSNNVIANVNDLSKLNHFSALRYINASYRLYSY